MDSERWVGFAIFLIVIVATGWALRRRRLRAEKTGDDPLYGVASPVTEAGAEGGGTH